MTSCMCVCVCVCACACLRACVHVCGVCGCLRACVGVYMIGISQLLSMLETFIQYNPHYI